MSKNFRLKVILRILILTCILCLLIYCLLVAEKYLRSVYLGVFATISILEFIYFIDKTNRNFTTFLTALLQNDFTTSFAETGNTRSLNDLHSTYNKITRKFHDLNSEKEMHHLYLEALVEHVKVGILSYDENEKIHLINNALKELLQKPQLLYLSGLKSVSPELLQVVQSLKPGENKLIKLTIDGSLLHLNIYAAEFKLKDHYHKLISFQNIKNELDANEMDAWQKLIRVLTHEIMNSVTPISSLSDTLHQIVQREENFNETTVEKVLQGLDAIRNRSMGLQSFTQAYRSLTQLPTPKYELFKTELLIDNVIHLLSPHLKNVDLKVIYETENIQILGDPKLLAQVLINLLKNGLEATEKSSEPRLYVKVNQTPRVSIEIQDNGSGIADDKIDQIFIPFFTTKSNGSGIGLALSQQIMRLHNGQITVSSSQAGTTFKLEF